MHILQIIYALQIYILQIIYALYACAYNIIYCVRIVCKLRQIMHIYNAYCMYMNRGRQRISYRGGAWVLTDLKQLTKNSCKQRELGWRCTIKVLMRGLFRCRQNYTEVTLPPLSSLTSTIVIKEISYLMLNTRRRTQN